MGDAVAVRTICDDSIHAVLGLLDRLGANVVAMAAPTRRRRRLRGRRRGSSRSRRGGVREAVARAADREPLLVQQLANAANQQHLVVLVIAPVAAPLHWLELGELLLPVAQHVRLDAAELAHLTDREVALGRNRWEGFLHENQ